MWLVDFIVPPEDSQFSLVLAAELYRISLLPPWKGPVELASKFKHILCACQSTAAKHKARLEALKIGGLHSTRTENTTQQLAFVNKQFLPAVLIRQAKDGILQLLVRLRCLFCSFIQPSLVLIFDFLRGISQIAVELRSGLPHACVDDKICRQVCAEVRVVAGQNTRHQLHAASRQD